MNPLVIISGSKDALLARETFVTDLYIYIYIYIYIDRSVIYIDQLYI